MLYEIRKTDMTGPMLATVEADTINDAASKAANLATVKAAFGRRSAAGFGVNRETGTVGRSGIWSLRQGKQSSHCGQIHITSSTGSPDPGR